MLESIEKLRECAKHESVGWFVNLEQAFGLSRYKCGDSTIKPDGGAILEAIADEIQAEIDASYMRLPVDADGVPIHVGDEMKQNGVKIGCVTAVGFHVEPRAWVLPKGRNVSVSFVAEGIRHVKPRTVEDVLSEAALEIVTVDYQHVPGVGNVPKISVDKDRLRDWLEEHDELRMRDDS